MEGGVIVGKRGRGLVGLLCLGSLVGGGAGGGLGLTDPPSKPRSVSDASLGSQRYLKKPIAPRGVKPHSGHSYALRLWLHIEPHPHDAKQGEWALRCDSR